jgi:hypothetical protein
MTPLPLLLLCVQKLSDDMIEEVIDSIFDTVKLQDGCIRYLDHLSLFAYHPIVEALLRK